MRSGSNAIGRKWMSTDSNQLKRNTAYLYASTIVKIVGPLITLPYLTRVLSVDAYGFVAFVKSYASYIQLLLDFGFLLSATKSIALADGDLHKVGRITGDTLIEKGILAGIGACGTGVLCIAVPLLGQNLLFTLLYYLSCVATITVLDFLFRGIQKMEYAAIPLTVSRVAVVFLTVALVKDDADLLLIPLIEVFGNLCAGIASLHILRKLDIAITVSSPRTWLRDLRESGVYFLSNFATSFFGALTTFVVGSCMEVSEVAFWSLSMTAISAVKAIYAPLGNSIYPYMVQAKDMALVNKIARKGIIPLAAMSFVVIFCGNRAMAIVGGESYAAAGDVLVTLLPVMIFSFYSMLYGWPVLGVFGSSRSVTATTITAAMIQVVSIFGFMAIGNLSLLTLAFCCDVSELFLLVSRLLVLRIEMEGAERADVNGRKDPGI